VKRDYVPLFDIYENNQIPLKYKCLKHPDKELQISLGNLKYGFGCPYCGTEKAAEKIRIPLEEVKQEFLKRDYIPLFDDRKNSLELLSYKCKKHLNFISYISLNSLKSGEGCPYCSLEQTQSKSCKKIEDYFINNNIIYSREYRFKDCKYRYRLPFDFAIFNNNELLYLIEYDGKQHFEPVSCFGDEEEFKLIKKRDQIKNNYCILNNIKLYRIPYWEDKNIEIILDNIIHNQDYKEFLIKEGDYRSVI
jgi:hypothetical protein